ncbi:hypothetical protein [Mycolicibacterium conceptionense]|nr:hypothetical protein [Mycolicibacterium conceptionense]
MEIHTELHRPGHGLANYVIESSCGTRTWSALSVEHAREQHVATFPNETIFSISPA